MIVIINISSFYSELNHELCVYLWCSKIEKYVILIMGKEAQRNPGLVITLWI